MLAPMREGGLWQIITLCALGAFGSWALRQAEISRKLGMGMHVPWAYGGAVLAYVTLVVIRPLLLGAWGHGFPYGIFSHLDWVSNVGYQYLHFHYNPGAHDRRDVLLHQLPGARHARLADPLGDESEEGHSRSARAKLKTSSSATCSATRSARSASTGSASSSPSGAAIWSAICIVISGPFWAKGWPEWWGWWLNLPIWR